MSTRLAFLNIGGLDRAGINRIHNAMISDNFVENQKSGFLLDKSFATEISGRFIRAVTRLEESVTPFGNKSSFERTVFYTQQFHLRKFLPNLIIENPSLAFKQFVSRLAEFSQFSISLNPLVSSVEKLIDILDGRTSALQVIALQTDEVSINPSVTAHVKFEGKGNLQLLAKQFLKPTSKLAFTSAKIEFVFNDRVYRCNLSNNGRVLIYGDDNSSLVNLLAETFASAGIT